MDPPRTGLDDKLLKTILDYTPEKKWYMFHVMYLLWLETLVSLAKVYDVNYIQSVDMFPHTARTEAVVKLTKKM